MSRGTLARLLVAAVLGSGLAATARGGEPGTSPLALAGPDEAAERSGAAVVFELLGRNVPNAAGAAAQFGYLTHLAGTPAEALFAGASQDETTAQLTFYSDTNTRRVRVNQDLRVIERDGVFAIYHDDSPDGDFSAPETFRDGEPVFLGHLRHQVIFNPGTGAFTATFVITVERARPFVLDGAVQRRIAARGQALRLHVSGQLPAGGGQGAIAAYAVQ